MSIGSHSEAGKAPMLLVGTVLAAVCLLALPSFASADYEQVPEHFGVTGEAEQLYQSMAIAVNVDGAGGVQAGSIYVAGQNGRVLRFSHGAEGEPPQFQEAWGWGIGRNEGGPLPEFQRCGPAYAAEPRPAGTFAVCRPPSPTGIAPLPGEEAGHFGELGGVAVDQATGDVYVLDLPNEGHREHHLIEVFTPTGQPVGAGFGDRGRSTPSNSPESIAEGPQNLHQQGISILDGIAVDAAGIVYVIDRDFPGVIGTPESRVMSFEPVQPGDFEHYVYAGQGKDITTSPANAFNRIALVGSNRLVAGSSQLIREYATGGGETPLCERAVTGGQEIALAANPLSGEVFYVVRGLQTKLRRLGACNEASKEFVELQAALTLSPQTESLFGLAVDPHLAWGAQRLAGILYGVDAEEHGAQRGIGDIFVPAEAQGPLVTSESVLNTTSTATTLQANIDPRGSTTEYAFQYLTEAQYEANEPDELQSLTVSATGGLFGLGFQGRQLGGAATAALSEGSTQATALTTAKGTATLKAAEGTATLHGAVGTGTVIAGSEKVTAAVPAEGAFATGQTISGSGIPSGTTITAASGSELTLSAKASESAANIALHAGSVALTALATTEGAFEVGMRIEGEGIPSNATILAVSGSGLTLSAPVTKLGTAVAITAGQSTLESLSVGEGVFEAGAPIAGEGIPSGTTITVVHPTFLEISKAPTKPGTAVAVSSSGPAPLAPGEVIEGPGIAPGTTILDAEAGKLTLSAAAISNQAEAHLRAGLPFDASAAEVRKALEGLSSIGKGNVKVSGGPGDESGSFPYEVTFSGSLTNRNLPELEADASGLSGGSASAVVATLHDGGGGFAGAADVPVPPATLDSSHIATAPLTGLSPETTYRFRAIAASHCIGPEEAPCEATGEAASFSTYPTAAPGLPDGRAYELVSPAQKNGGEVFPSDPRISSCGGCKPPGGGSVTGALFPMKSAPGGDAVAYEGYPFSPEEGAAVYNSYISRRTATGWQTTAMSPRRLSSKASLAYSESLGQGLIAQTQPTEPQLAEDAPAGYGNLYRQQAGDPAALEPLLTEALFAAHPPQREPSAWRLEYKGHSPDFSAQYFAVNDALTGSTAYAPQPPDPGPSGRDLYEWRAGALSLINVLPGNAAVATGASFASASPDAHGMSTDGRRVFWEAGGQLYLREDNRTTREIHDPGAFLTASPDGRTILLSDGCIYALEEGKCAVDLTQGHGGFLGLFGQSEDLSRIYFADKAALSAGAEAGSCQRPTEFEQREEEQEGLVPAGFGCNLYLYEAGAGTRFVATLAARDGEGGAVPLDDWASEPGTRTAEASPDGRYLAFGSSARLTGYGNVGPCEGAGPNFQTGPCKEAFLYDSATDRLSCPSCNPSGEAPLGNSTLRVILNAAQVSPWLPQPRYLTNRGRLFFDSQDRLSARDTNGGVEDVYEYEPNGVGSCERAQGCVTLISPGSGEVDSNFLSMGGEGEAEGSDVFFTTRERLVPIDTDELIDLYDARVGGGFASETETTRPECQGEACQPAPNPPAEVTPASAAFQGAGNLEEGGKSASRCPKGKRAVKSRGKTRCVAKHKKKHKRHHRRKQRRANADRRAHR